MDIPSFTNACMREREKNLPMIQRTFSMLLCEFYQLTIGPVEEFPYHTLLPYKIKFEDTWQQP